MPTKAEIQAANQGGDSSESSPQLNFNEAQVKDKIQTIEDNVNKQLGRKGCNPHFWLNSTVMPLVNRFLAGERTPELQSAILALPDSPPALNMELGMTEDEQRKKYAKLQQEQTAQPIGLLMPKH